MKAIFRLVVSTLCLALLSASQASLLKIDDVDRLLAAILSDDEPGIKRLVAAGVSVTETRSGQNAISLAACSKNTESLKFVLTEGQSDLPIKDRALTALYRAVGANRIENVNFILDSYVSFDIYKKAGSTLLGTAVLLNYYDMSKALLDHGADPLGATGEHVPMLDASRRSLPWLKLFLRYSHPFVKSSGGETALCMAVKSSVENVKLLAEYGLTGCELNNWGRNIYFSMTNPKIDRTSILSFFVKRHVNINVRDRDGNTPLHFFSSLGDLEMVRELLHRGADKSVKNLAGKTAEEVARDSDNEAVAKAIHRFIGSKEAVEGK